MAKFHLLCLGTFLPNTRQVFRGGLAMPEKVSRCCDKPEWPAEVRLLIWLSWLALVVFVGTCAGTRLLHADHGLTVAMTVFATLPAVAALSLSIRAWKVAQQYSGASRKLRDRCLRDTHSQMIARLRRWRDVVCAAASHPWRALTGWVRRWEAHLLFGMYVCGSVLFLLPPWISQLPDTRLDVWTDLVLALIGLFFAVPLGVVLERSKTTFLVGALVMVAFAGGGLFISIFTSDNLMKDFIPLAPSYFTVGVAVVGACVVPLWSRHIAPNPSPER